jgi:ABC-type bacteriocin/lantibiotic exporter with double-glycine peptidase domain
MPGAEILPRAAALCLGLAAIVSGAGCFSPLLHSVDEQRLRDGGGYEIVGGLSVPPVRGVEGCGAQALATVLAYHDPALDVCRLAEELPWHTEGATPVDLLLAARQRGFGARIARGSWDELAESVRQGRPPLVMFDAAPQVGVLLLRVPVSRMMHWSVVSGVAADGSRVLLAARDHRHHVVKRDDFLDRWSKSAYCTIIVTRRRSGPQTRR